MCKRNTKSKTIRRRNTMSRTGKRRRSLKYLIRFTSLAISRYTTMYCESCVLQVDTETNVFEICRVVYLMDYIPNEFTLKVGMALTELLIEIPRKHSALALRLIEAQHVLTANVSM